MIRKKSIKAKTIEPQKTDLYPFLYYVIMERDTGRTENLSKLHHIIYRKKRINPLK